MKGEPRKKYTHAALLRMPSGTPGAAGGLEASRVAKGDGCRGTVGRLPLARSARSPAPLLGLPAAGRSASVAITPALLAQLDRCATYDDWHDCMCNPGHAAANSHASSRDTVPQPLSFLLCLSHP